MLWGYFLILLFKEIAHNLYFIQNVVGAANYFLFCHTDSDASISKIISLFSHQ